uniref:Uncharacterized protein n=1 Tax=Caenorhabditis japonica TaxID=281687 RepID=A0A8R1EC96_CAEJA
MAGEFEGSRRTFRAFVSHWLVVCPARLGMPPKRSIILVTSPPTRSSDVDSDSTLIVQPQKKRGKRDFELSDVISKFAFLEITVKKMQCTIEELQLLVETQQCEMDAQRKEIDLLKMSGASFPPLSSSSSGSMSASRRQCSLYSNIVSKDPMVNKVSDRLALASDLMEIEKKSVVAVVENLLDSKEDNQELKD